MLLQTLRPVKELADGGMEVERRAVIRYLCDRDVVYSRFSKRERLWARVRDISANGIGLLLSAAIAPGTDLLRRFQSVIVSEAE
jgi:hypothetical protein